MSELQRMGRPECDELLDELEGLRGEAAQQEEVLAELTAATSRHVATCEDCRRAIEDFVATRAAVEPMKAPLAVAGPWFVTRVMAAIRNAEKEMEERKEGVWVSVRRLAPRLAAFAVLLLVLGGTWAMELRRREASTAQSRQAEGLFETGTGAPMNDDIVATATEGNRP